MRRKRTKDIRPNCTTMSVCLDQETRGILKEYADFIGLSQSRPSQSRAIMHIVKEWKKERNIVLNGTITKIINEKETSN